MAKKIRDEEISLSITINGSKAQKELHELERAQRDLNASNKALRAEKKRLEAQNKKGTAEWKRADDQLRENNRTLDKNKVRMEILRKEVGLTGMTMRQLKSEANRLRLLLYNLIPGSAEYKKYQNELKAISTRMSELRAKGRQSQGALSSLAGAFNKYAVMGTALIASITGIVFSLNSLADGSAKLSDAQSDVEKTTGLTSEAVRQLTGDLRSIDTRTPRLELIKLAEEAGRLGKDSRQDVLAFVEAADKMNVALGDDLGGPEAIREVGKLSGVFKIGEERGENFSQGMMRLGSAINEVSAKGANQAGFLVNYLKRISGVSVQADIAAEKQIGFAAALDETGQAVEVSGTAMSQVITAMFKDTSTFAKIARMDLKDFEELLQEDANEALLKFLEGLNGNNDGLRKVAERLDQLGLDGQRATSVLASLAANTDLVRERQEQASSALEENTSLIDEFNKKNTNMAANLEIIKKRMYGAFISSRVLEGITSITAALRDMITVPVSETLEEERLSLRKVELQLYDTNTSTEDRKKLIEELKTEYPGYLGHIDADTASNEELSEAIRKVNDQLVNKIILQKQDEKIQSQQQEIAERQKEFFNAQDKLQEQIIEKAERHGIALNQNATLLEQAAQLQDQLPKNNSGMSAGGMDQLALDIMQVRAAEEHLKKARKDNNALIDEREKLEKRLGITLEEADKKLQGSGGGEIDSRISQLAQQIGDSEEALQMEYFRSMKSFKEFQKDKLKAAGKTQKEITELTDEQIDARDAAMERIQDVLRKAAGEEDEIIRAKYRKLIDLAKEHKIDLVDELKEAMNAEIIEKIQDQTLKEWEEEDKKNEEKLKKAEEFEKERRALLDKYGILTDEDKLKHELELLQDIYDEGLLKHEEFLQAQDFLNQQYTEKELEEWKAAQTEKWQYRAEIANGFAEIVTGLKNLELANIEEVSQKDYEVMQRKNETEEQFQERKRQAEARYTEAKNKEEQKRHEVAKKYAFAEAMATVARIGAETALAVIKVFPNPALMASAGVAGGIQAAVALKEAQKIRSLDEGLYDVIDQKGDRYRAQRNEELPTGLYKKPTVSYSKNMLIAEKRPEIVVDGLTTKKLMQFHPEVLDTINAVRHGRTARGYAEGNYPQAITNSPQTNITKIDLAETNMLLRQLLAKEDRPIAVGDPEIRKFRKRIEKFNDIERKA